MSLLIINLSALLLVGTSTTIGYVYPAGQQPPDTVLYTHEMQAETVCVLFAAIAASAGSDLCRKFASWAVVTITHTS